MFTAKGEGQFALLSLVSAGHGFVMHGLLTADQVAFRKQSLVGLPLVFGLHEPATEEIPEYEMAQVA